MTAVFVLAFLPMLAGDGPAATGNPPDELKGTLVIDGGGQPHPDVKRRALEIAGGPKAKVVILPWASDLPEAGAKAEKRWREAGATDVSVLLRNEPKLAADAIRHADLVWIGGGDQERLMKRLKGTGIVEAIAAMHRDGGVVGGSSAGAAVMSGVMIERGVDEFPGPLSDYPILGRGLGLWPGVIVDQHFLKLKRLTRLKKAMTDNPGLIGVGIDESTAAFVRGRTIEVIGKSPVTIVDPRPIKKKVRIMPVSASGGGDAPAPDAVEPRVLSVNPGMKFDLERGMIVDPIAETR